jgi:hypothetical protein
MSLQELGALGEFIGGVAVLFTLIYLAYQVRQSNKLIDDQRILSRAEQTGRSWELVLDSNREFERVYPLFKKFDEGKVLTEEELLKLDTWLVNLLNVLRRAKSQSDIGEYDSPWESWVSGMVPFVFSDGFGRLWWEGLKVRDFDKDFVAAMDAALAEENRTTYATHLNELSKLTLP